MQVAKWGDSLVVRLPDSMVAALKLHEGDEIDISITPLLGVENDKQRSVAELLASLRRLRGRIDTADFRFDREEANARH